MANQTRKASVRTPVIPRILRRDRTRLLVRLALLEVETMSHEIGVENLTEVEEGVVPGLCPGPESHSERPRIDAPAATARLARLARHLGVLLVGGLSPIPRRHHELDEDHDPSHPPRPGRMARPPAGQTAIRDLHQGFRRLLAETGTYRALSHLHHAVDLGV